MSISLKKLDKSLLLSAANECSSLTAAAGKHTHLSVHHSTTEYEQKKVEDEYEVLKSDEGHTQTHVEYKLQDKEHLCSQLSLTPQLDNTTGFPMVLHCGGAFLSCNCAGMQR